MQEINGNTQILGIIGKPVKHTLSPLIHNFLAESLGHPMVYVPFEVQGDVHAAVQGAYTLGIKGLNVTVPYKSAVMEDLVETDAAALQIGAVNTLVRTEKGYKGYNTDVLGLKRELYEEKIPITGERVIILGAGGAARAVAFLCAYEGAKSICILNRNIDKAMALAADVNSILSKPKDYVQGFGLSDYARLEGDDYLAFQCTSVGLFPNEDEAVTVENDFYRKLKYAVDLIYTPRVTKFMQMASAMGCHTTNGMKMLLYQAIAAYELWTGERIADDLADKAYELLMNAVNCEVL